MSLKVILSNAAWRVVAAFAYMPWWGWMLLFVLAVIVDAYFDPISPGGVTEDPFSPNPDHIPSWH